ncbi:MAG: NfeD family protein [Bacteroidales bacterium]|nr:NfeD family protein [Bacteroidales bacterium]
MGKANFNGEIVEVASYQDFIDENKQIVIIKIDENKIIVKLNS